MSYFCGTCATIQIVTIYLPCRVSMRRLVYFLTFDAVFVQSAVRDECAVTAWAPLFSCVFQRSCDLALDLNITLYIGPDILDSLCQWQWEKQRTRIFAKLSNCFLIYFRRKWYCRLYPLYLGIQRIDYDFIDMKFRNSKFQIKSARGVPCERICWMCCRRSNSSYTEIIVTLVMDRTRRRN